MLNDEDSAAYKPIMNSIATRVEYQQNKHMLCMFHAISRNLSRKFTSNCPIDWEEISWTIMERNMVNIIIFVMFWFIKIPKLKWWELFFSESNIHLVFTSVQWGWEYIWVWPVLPWLERFFEWKKNMSWSLFVLLIGSGWVEGEF